ncbi:MAG: hypothetical protein WD355_07485 [Balneolaceae bacterium]
MNDHVSATTEYRAFDGRVVSENEEKVLLHSARGKQQAWVRREAMDLLFFCQSFAPLHVHAEEFFQFRQQSQQTAAGGGTGLLRAIIAGLNRFWQPSTSRQVALLIKELEQFVRLGFLVARSEIQEEIVRAAQNHTGFNPNIEAGQGEEISVMGIPTCDRPDMLKRCLKSFLKNFMLHRHQPDILILDDSRSEDARAKNRDVLRELEQSYSGRIRSMDRSQRRQFARSLSDSAGVDPAVMEFALMGHPSCNRSEGGARNAFLLLTQGTLALQTDDDTICRPAQLPSAREGIKLSSSFSSDEYWYFDSFEEAAGAVELTDSDFLSLHRELLGRPLQSILEVHTGNGQVPDIDNMNVAFLNGLKTDKASIRMSLPGPAGDTCLFSDLYKLFLEGESLDRLLYPQEGYTDRLSTRQVIRGVSRPVISDVTRCIGMNFAVDNRSLLPPFMPVQARCDGIFGDLMAVCFPHAYSGNIPWVIPHQTPEPRARTVDDVFSLLQKIRVNDLVAVLILSRHDRLDGKDEAANLQSLGQMFTRLGAMTGKQFSDELRQIYQSVTRQRVNVAARHLFRNMDAPSYWKEHLHRYIQVLENSAESFDYLQPDDIDKPSTDRREDFQEILRLFGELLLSWPAVYDTMGAIADEEITTTWLTEY